VKKVWERFLDYELGQLHFAMDALKELQGRDPAELLPATLPDPIAFSSQRDFVRKTLESEVNLRARGTDFVDASTETAGSPSVQYRDQLNRDGSPSDTVTAGYIWMPGTELVSRASNGGSAAGRP
jgi:hypothetical protein